MDQGGQERNPPPPQRIWKHGNSTKIRVSTKIPNLFKILKIPNSEKEDEEKKSAATDQTILQIKIHEHLPAPPEQERDALDYPYNCQERHSKKKSATLTITKLLREEKWRGYYS